MNKKIIGLIGAAVLVMALPLQGLAAADAAANLQSVEGGAKVSLDLQHTGAGEGVNALQMSFTLSPVVGSLDKADVSFVFDEDLPGTVKTYRYNQSTNVLTVYVAGANGALFENDKADLGSIQVEAAKGEYLEVSITTGLPNQEEGSSAEMVSGLTLLRASSSAQKLTMQAETLAVNVGELSPAPEPTQRPEATETPEATQQPQATEKPQASEKPEATQKPSGGSTGGSQNGSTQNNTAAATAQPGTAASSKAPGASASQSAVSEAASEESQAQSESASREAESQAAESESQAQSQSTASQTQKSKMSVLPVVIGVAVVAAAAVAGVVIWRRGRD